MAAAGSLTADQLRDALAERLAIDRGRAPFLAPHFVEMALAASGTPRPSRIETTLDLELQAEVEGILDQQRESLRRHGAHNVAVVVLDNARREWIAWEGSGDYLDTRHGGAINGPTVPRQPGSALKPFTYALAFEEGKSPASVLADIPSHFPTAEPGVLYSPRNYDGRYRGPLLARRALAGSENVPAVALASEIGVPTLVRFLTRSGFTTFDRNASYYGLGVTLGNAEVRLDQLVAAYATFARGGVWREPVFLQNAHRGADRPIVSPRTAFWITSILSDAEARSFIFGRGGDLEFPFDVAVKTGTSQAYHDNWTVGYTRQVTVGVWVGNFDRTPLRDSSGVTGAGPIFHAVMLAAERRVGNPASLAPVASPPSDVQEVAICAISGMRANAWCPTRTLEWLPMDDEALPCAWHHRSDDGLVTIYPPEYRAWAGTPPARAESGASGAPGPGLGLTVSVPGLGTSGPALAIANPPPGAIYSIDPTLRADFQALPLRATTASRTAIAWSVDGRPIGTVSSEEALAWPLRVGTHVIEARDASGRRAEASVMVR
jgi:penicillin-binding protein 1C